MLDEAEVEQLLVEAFDDVRASVVEQPDLFARVERSLAESEARRSFRLRLGAAITAGTADVFGANPRTGKSYLVLTDVAYYLVFAAYILLSMRFVETRSWVDHRLVQLQHEVARVGGMLLLLGGLHTANVLALSVIGNLLNAVRRPRLASHDTDPAGTATSGSIRPVTGALTTPPLGPGTWLLHIEPAGDTSNALPTTE
jgi:hypothetical protein